MTIFLVELEGVTAEAATDAGQKFLCGATLLEAMRHLTGQDLVAVPLGLSINFGHHSPEAFEAIKAEWSQEIANLGPLANGLVIDEIAPAWAILEAPNLEVDNATFRLRHNGSLEHMFSGVEL